MNFWQNGFHRAIGTFRVPDGLGFFLDLYSWESILFCVVAPFFFAVPILLITLATHFHFLISFILIIAALIITFPWLVVPYWIVKEKSVQRRVLIFWGIYNACFVFVYFALFI